MVLLSVLLGLLFALTGLAESWHKEKNEKEEIKVKLEQIQKQYEQLKISKTASSPKKVAATTTSKPQTKQAVVIPVDKQVIADYIRSKFKSEYAVRIAVCESGLNPQATGSALERGIFQIHPVHAVSMTKVGFTWASMYNWKSNVDYAYLLYSWHGWSPWSCRNYV